MNSDPKFPLAVVTGYGPNHKTATKLVAAIFAQPDQSESAAIEKWSVQDGDVRDDPAIGKAVAHFIEQHHAAENVSYRWAMGCPHEEGIDYPEGESCPHCPFWANLDRYTLEPVSLDQPLTAEQILAGLSRERDTQPLKVLAAVELHREQLVGPFLSAVERCLNDPKGASEDDAMLFNYALAFLGKWRELRVFPLLIRWLSLPGEDAFAIGGDTVVEWSPRLLASVCGADIAPLKQLILNRDANEYCRAAAVEALTVLVAWNQRPQTEIAEYFGWLAREGLEREPHYVWGQLAAACIDIEAISAFDDLRQAGEEGFIDPGFIEVEQLEKVEAEPRGQAIAKLRHCMQPFDDIAKETSWWSAFAADPFDEIFSDNLFDDLPPPVPGYNQIPETEEFPKPQPYIAPLKIGRNEPCPCGSGKKYKKCCGA